MKLCEHDSCCGCGACADKCPRHCITMKPDPEGFMFPEINQDSCVNCGLCEKTCPILHPVTSVHEPVTVYAAWAKDDAVRTSSSSGGLFSIFGEAVLKENGVINGAAFDSDMVLKHSIASHPGDTAKFRGSKYVQSHTDGIYSKIKKKLDSGRNVLFTSVPCQVAALKSFLGKEYDNLITCDILCHGVPSQKYLMAYLKSQCPIARESIKSIGFRTMKGWGDFRMRVNQESWIASKLHNGYLFHFLNGANYNNECYHCLYANKKRVGDITLGDFWGIGKITPFGHDTKKGCSLVIVNTEKGKVFFEKVKDQLFYEERTYDEAIRENSQIYRPTIRPALRDQFSEKTFNRFYTVSLVTLVFRKIKTVLRKLAAKR